ncbi:trifunctional histidinol dehydrogenase [Tulasnella sp. 403]|nr:trifunctional histidinol dehydrogenase [Tulasnella sp. 403]
MPSPFLPLVESGASDELLRALGRIGPVILDSSVSGLPQTLTSKPYKAVLSNESTVDDVIRLLDGGCEHVAIPLTLAKDVIGVVPPERIWLLLDVGNVTAISEKVRNGVSGILLKTPGDPDLDFISSFRSFFAPETQIYVHPATTTGPPSPAHIRELQRSSVTLVIPSSKLTLGASSTTQLNVSDAFLSSLVSDRPDGLFPTVVSAFNHSGKALGLVYSSTESIAKSILTGDGWYQSRKHGLWRKGETSGATQKLVRINIDCDSDALEFQVIQEGSGFCHTGTASCFGDLSGHARLERTLRARLADAPEDSYTKRLFTDPTLLRSKIKEEADEVCSAQTKEEIAAEAADLLYFTLTLCVGAGVGLQDIEASLDKKAMKVTRRPGNAKPQYLPHPTQAPIVKAGDAATPVAQPTPAPSTPDDTIKMRTVDLTTTSPSERQALLRRPVLRSDEMIQKVKPIIDQVRSGGDAALKTLTAKFDKAVLEENVLRPPFDPSAMSLDAKVKDAIDRAYSNIRTFHAAQAEKEPLVVETMPGVVCTRFARPIARVGLYVPGGTAVLPSTALMLGIPAQVAGCKEIVMAVPPCADGTVVPEVLYAAHLVGASAVLKAGGAQAIAAMAYGTETVPKVDKIFGPGNQWVTAAKMAVQNDTDALVSIDMPAGPSEVLVIADHTAEPSFVAADLLSQAEHGVDSQVVLVAINLTDSQLEAIEKEVDVQAKALPRVDIVRQSISKSLTVRTTSLEDALAFSNEYAPEHLILHLEDAPAAVKLVENAGSVFVGAYSPESCGDYASGTNHTLPTNGYARQFSGVNTLSFQKHITSQQVSQEGLKELGPIVVTIAERESLEAHANAVRVRLNKL